MPKTFVFQQTFKIARVDAASTTTHPPLDMALETEPETKVTVFCSARTKVKIHDVSTEI